jgi:hypothetical protein
MDNVLKRLSVDLNKDKVIDYVLINNGYDKEPDYKFNGDGNTTMLE